MIPSILAACPTLERYRSLSHNTLEELGLPRCPLRVEIRTSRPSCRMSVLPPRTDIQRPLQHVRFVPYSEVSFCQLISRRQVIPFNCGLAFALAVPALSATGAPPRFSRALDRNRVAVRP